MSAQAVFEESGIVASIASISARLEVEVLKSREMNDTATSTQIRAHNEIVREIKAELVAAITAGARSCPSCGEKPHGMLQEMQVSGEVHHGFEVGCTNCRDHRAKGVTREITVSKWNLGPVHGGWRQPKDGTRLELVSGEVFRVEEKGGVRHRVSCKVVSEGA